MEQQPEATVLNILIASYILLQFEQFLETILLKYMIRLNLWDHLSGCVLILDNAFKKLNNQLASNWQFLKLHVPSFQWEVDRQQPNIKTTNSRKPVTCRNGQGHMSSKVTEATSSAYWTWRMSVLSLKHGSTRCLHTQNGAPPHSLISRARRPTFPVLLLIGFLPSTSPPLPTDTQSTSTSFSLTSVFSPPPHFANGVPRASATLAGAASIVLFLSPRFHSPLHPSTLTDSQLLCTVRVSPLWLYTSHTT